MPAKKKSKDAASRERESDLSSLVANENNPRKPWSPVKKTHFEKSLSEFGDLSGVVFNIQSSRLVGGHKRIEALSLDKAAKVVVTDRLDSKDSCGTTAYGYVVMSNGARYSYREVDWPAEKEKAALLAANKWSAEWDMEAVASLVLDLPPDWQSVSGFDLGELSLLKTENDSDWSEEEKTRQACEVQAATHETVSLSVPLSAFDDFKKALTLFIRKHPGVVIV